MRKEDYQRFFRKYLRRQHSEAEHRAFLLWFASLTTEQASEVIDEYEKLMATFDAGGVEAPDRALIAKIEEGLDGAEFAEDRTSKHAWLWKLPRIAAAVLLFGLLLSYYNYYRQPGDSLKEQSLEDVAPGDNRALLTLADGSAIVLSDVEMGEIAKQSLVRIAKDGEGQLVYSPEEDYHVSAANLKKEYNAVATPKSGQYKVLLPDGTKVWLNSMSSLRFPVTFDPVERKVELAGEAYFEVAKAISSGRHIPFRVVSNGQQIEVTGTKFNVNTYSDDSYIKTTLLEGGVRVQEAGTGSAVDLRPGEQSLVRFEENEPKGANRPISVRKADVEGDLAWTNGYFYFKDTELREVMQQLIRWYDIEVEYIGTPSAERFNGYVSRNISLSHVLEMLSEGSDLTFELQGGAQAKVKVISQTDVSTERSS